MSNQYDVGTEMSRNQSRNKSLFPEVCAAIYAGVAASQKDNHCTLLQY